MVLIIFFLLNLRYKNGTVKSTCFLIDSSKYNCAPINDIYNKGIYLHPVGLALPQQSFSRYPHHYIDNDAVFAFSWFAGYCKNKKADAVPKSSIFGTSTPVYPANPLPSTNCGLIKSP